MRPIPFHLIGFSSEDDAKSAVNLVDKAIFETSQQLGLNIESLDGVTIAYDYRAALAGLDRGFQSNNPLTPTGDSIADGVAMAPMVRRDGRVMSHVVLNASILPTIEQPISGLDGRYLIAHELAHVHEHHCRDQVLPNTLLEPFDDPDDHSVLWQIAEACWCEYAACYLSAAIAPSHAAIFETTVVDVLTDCRPRIIAIKQRWILDRDFGAALTAMASEAGAVLKYVCYLLGHAAGLDKPPDEIAPRAWEVMRGHDWLYPWVEKTDTVLRDLLERFEEWTGMNAFAPLKEVARGLLADCGVSLTQRDGKPYVVVSAAKVWITP